MNNNVNPRSPYSTEGRTPDKAGQFYCQVVETKTWRIPKGEHKLCRERLPAKLSA